MLIRHQIDALSGSFSTTQTIAGDLVVGGFFLIDTSKYSGTLSYYIEVLYTNTRTTDQFVYFGGNSSTSRVVLTASTSTLTLARVQATSGTFGISASLNWAASASVGTVTVKAARLIIFQDTGTDPLLASESQFEIGNQELAVTVTTASTLQPLAAPKYWKYTAANFDGAAAFYAECTYLVSSTTGSKTIVVQESNDLASWATAATMLSAASGSVTAARVRSSSFVPKNGYYYRLAWTNSSTMTTVNIYNAKIIVDQTDNRISGTPTNDLLCQGGTASSSQTGQAAGGVVKTTNGGIFTGIKLYLKKFGSPADSLTISLVDSALSPTVTYATGTISGSSLTTSYVQYSINFSSATSSIPAGTNLYFRIERSPDSNDTSNYYSTSFISGSGSHYSRDNNTWSFGSGDVLVELIGGGGITTLEEHYLLANTTLAAGTALQTFLTKWDPTEWSGVTNTYNHQIDASASNTSVVEIDGITSAAQVSGSVVTSPNRYGISSAMTMPASQNIDVKATTNSGSIFGSRIIVTIVKTVIASIPNKIYSINQSVNRASTF